MPKLRRVPQRTCVCCGLKTDKRDLLRVVSTTDEKVVIDITGKRNGRGAYICLSCRGSSSDFRRDRMELSLRTKINENDWEALVQIVKTLA